MLHSVVCGRFCAPPGFGEISAPERMYAHGRQSVCARALAVLAARQRERGTLGNQCGTHT